MYAPSGLAPGAAEGRAPSAPVSSGLLGPSQQLQQLQQLFSSQQPANFPSFFPSVPGAAASATPAPGLSLSPPAQSSFFPTAGVAQPPSGEPAHAVYPHMPFGAEQAGRDPGAGVKTQGERGGSGEEAVRAAQEQLSKLQHLFAAGQGVAGQNGTSRFREDERGARARGDAVGVAGSADGAGRGQGEDGTTGRMAVFIDYPAAAFSLVPEDVRNFLSVFGTVKQVSLSRRRAAADVLISPAAAVDACVKELNETFLPGFGVLRVSPLAARGPPIEELLPASTADPLAPPGVGKAAPAEAPPGRREPDEARFDRREAKAKGDSRKGDEDRRREGRKQVCRLELVGLFTYEPEFDVTRALLGEHNGNISYIMDQTQHKVDLSIKGKAVNEAPVAERLHLSLSSDDAEAYEKALNMAEDLLQSVCEQFVAFCRSKHLPPPVTATFRRHQYEQQPDGSLTYLGVTERAPVWLGSSPSHSSSNRGGSSPPPLASSPTSSMAPPASMAPAGLSGPPAASALLPGGAGAQMSSSAPVAGLPGPGSPSNGASAGLPAASLLAAPHLAPMPHPLPHPGGLPLPGPLGHPHPVGLPALSSPSGAGPAPHGALGHLPHPGATPGAPGALLAHPAHVSRPPHLDPLAGPHPLGLPHPHGVSHLAPPPGSFLPPGALAPHPFGVGPHPAPGGVLVPPGLGDFAAAMEAALAASGAGGRAPGNRREGRRSRSRERGSRERGGRERDKRDGQYRGGSPAASRRGRGASGRGPSSGRGGRGGSAGRGDSARGRGSVGRGEGR
ncbi:Plasmodium vivax PV1H14060_P, related [Neospora caninum Liverpool]|uniref:Plasmodium vivax PV1H14060_P, related n=1 Tax=Neospora caninum (strain Liverpool) TaxID=572307 RepID=F0VLV2_NEOCL|nr:Plasmodium vivax PV1H14060_P, related [Neospora caninum Liverpool]CBZ54230.1 Plasmodium vivax PV1H14060_P, related [Neospora caninum Liverpool]CEL68932.1 TPA: Plasmodium vivax PV1H14060_P, related [Neospora caninum Liverpool]|eukprot:XP_003884261.1 Plasmodium vivax PV1H14060_P, related [Neospora caninum Liverpool]